MQSPLRRVDGLLTFEDFSDQKDMCLSLPKYQVEWIAKCKERWYSSQYKTNSTIIEAAKRG